MSGTDKRQAATLRPTLVGRLVIAVNVALIVVLGLFLVWDYRVTWEALLEQKRTALEDEAKVLLPAIERLRERGPEALQSYIDEACGAMQDSTSPGHHIAVRMGEEVLQARPHHRASAEMLAGMLAGASDYTRLASVGGEIIVVGSASRPSVAVYVSEYLDNIEAVIHGQVLRRFLSILLLGLSLAIVLNAMLHRLLARPLRSMVPVVRRFGQGDLSARMPEFQTKELGLLADEFDQMAGELERAESERHRRMSKARRIQRNLQPDATNVAGVKVESAYQPADEVAGDYYDILSLQDGALLFCVGDVSGHGIPAAMGAAMLKAILETAIAQKTGFEGLAGLLNRGFCRVALEEDFATMLLVRWDSRRRILSYVSAGHESGYLLRGKRAVETLGATGPVFGFQEDARWDTREFPVEPGDRLILLTDGVTEAMSASGETFGRERVRKLLQDAGSLPLDHLIGSVLEQIMTHRGVASQSDDVTILAAEF